MKDPSDAIRDWLHGVLNGMITYSGSYVPVYSFVPKNAAKPYIVLAEQSMAGDQSTKDAFITEHEFIIGVISGFTGNDASYAPVNAISDSISLIVRQWTTAIYGSGGSYVSPVTGFNLIRAVIKNTRTDRTLHDEEIILYKNITLSLLLEQT